VTVLNPAPARVLPLPPDLLGLVDYLTPNEGEAGLLTGRDARSFGSLDDAETAGRELVAAGVGAAVVTLGAAGSVALERPGCIRVPGFTVSPVDTVGAGDAFNGGLATLLAAGASLGDAMLVANAAGALACTRAGAADSLPTRSEEVEALMKREGRWPAIAW